MSRRIVDVKIDDQTYEVRELKVKEIIEILQDPLLTEDASLNNLKPIAAKHLSKITTATLDDLINMAPSDIEKLVDKFKEVNSSFLSSIRAVGIDKWLSELKKAAIEDFGKVFVGSSKLATLK